MKTMEIETGKAETMQVEYVAYFIILYQSFIDILPSSELQKLSLLIIMNTIFCDKKNFTWWSFFI